MKTTTTSTRNAPPASASWRTRGLIVAGFAALSSLFSLLHYTPLQFVSVNMLQALFLVILGAIAAIGCALKTPALLLAAGVIFIVIGLVRLVTYSVTVGAFAGSVNAAALAVGLGTAFVAIWVTTLPMPKRG